MYQKSPFPYLFTLVIIIGVSSFTNLTIDKEITQPIVHIINQESSIDELMVSKQFSILKDSTQIAYNKQLATH